MNADILFSSHLLGGRITSLAFFFFPLPFFVGAIFLRTGWKEREREIMGQIKFLFRVACWQGDTRELFKNTDFFTLDFLSEFVDVDSVLCIFKKRFFLD